MKLSLLSPKTVSALTLLGLLTGLPTSALAITQTYSNGSLVWDGSTTNWTGGLWNNSVLGTDAVFSGATETVAIGNDLSGGVLNIGSISVSGGAITLDNSLGNSIAFQNSGASSGSVTINNVAGVQLNNGAQLGNVAVNNGGTILVSGSAATSLGNVNNFNGFAGGITAGTSNLTVGSLTLSNADPSTFGQNTLSFTLPSQPNTSPSGQITVSGVFTVPTSFADATPFRNSLVDGGPILNDGPVVIAISGINITGLPLAPSYTLIDWGAPGNLAAAGPGFSGGSLTTANVNQYFSLDLSNASGVNLSAATRLEVQGNTLVLVAVPEPATVAMPLAACLGLLVLRRRAARMPLVQA